MNDSIEARLEQTRRNLLDLTRRNRLLNCGVARSAVRIVGELPEEVFETIVVAGKTMQFLSLEEAQPEAAALIDAGRSARPDGPDAPGAPTDDQELDPAGTLPLAPTAQTEGPRHRDLFLQTVLPGEKLQNRLVYLARQAKSVLEEQGCNVLYLALGTVEWRDPDARGVTSRAPLVFVPVELRRKNVHTRYDVRAFDDEILTNPCLVELG
ncbi:MAG: DUF4011 domain-containing protein, partial [Candidatus Riflebacteria bacterium]|nr:DUF4011 domain-containing protein [Candidatus Riflebacteria bacterium]